MKEIERQIEKYLIYCKQVRNMSEATIRAKQNVLKRFMMVMINVKIFTLDELTNDAFNKWMISERARGISARSMNIYNSIVIAMIRYYCKIGLDIPLDLTLILKLKEGPIRREFYTANEIRRVIEIARMHGDIQTELLIRIMFETGMRIAEITRLEIANFEFCPNEQIGRRISFIGKGQKLREVYITSETQKLLCAFIKQWGITKYLWHAMDGGVIDSELPPLTTQTVREYLKQVFFEAGFVDFYPHALRHSFATDLQMRGASVAEIKEMIGHSNIATTERYLHGFDGRMQELFDKYRG